MIKDEKFWDELEVFHMPDDYTNNTITFSMEEVREADMKRILLTVYDALKEKGYNLIRRIDRDELLKAMVRSYLGE